MEARITAMVQTANQLQAEVAAERQKNATLTATVAEEEWWCERLIGERDQCSEEARAAQRAQEQYRRQLEQHRLMPGMGPHATAPADANPYTATASADVTPYTATASADATMTIAAANDTPHGYIQLQPPPGEPAVAVPFTAPPQQSQPAEVREDNTQVVRDMSRNRERPVFFGASRIQQSNLSPLNVPVTGWYLPNSLNATVAADAERMGFDRHRWRSFTFKALNPQIIGRFWFNRQEYATQERLICEEGTHPITGHVNPEIKMAFEQLHLRSAIHYTFTGEHQYIEHPWEAEYAPHVVPSQFWPPETQAGSPLSILISQSIQKAIQFWNYIEEHIDTPRPENDRGG